MVNDERIQFPFSEYILGKTTFYIQGLWESKQLHRQTIQKTYKANKFLRTSETTKLGKGCHKMMTIWRNTCSMYKLYFFFQWPPTSAPRETLLLESPLSERVDSIDWVMVIIPKFFLTKSSSVHLKFNTRSISANWSSISCEKGFQHHSESYHEGKSASTALITTWPTQNT